MNTIDVEIDIAIVGATGVVGEALIEALDSSLMDLGFEVGELHLLASTRSDGETRMYRQRPLLVESLDDFDFARVQLAFFAAPAAVAAEYAPLAVEQGCRVIDFSVRFRADPQVPLVVAGVNDEALASGDCLLVALPGALTTDLSLIVRPIHQVTEICRIHVASYQSVSTAGQAGARELARQTSCLLNGLPVEPGLFPEQIAFNIVPQVGEIDREGHSETELDLVAELRKLMEGEEIPLSATCVQVPIFYGSCQAISLEMRYPTEIEEVVGILKGIEGLELADPISHYATSLAMVEKASGFRCAVGRIRSSLTIENGIDLWIVSDAVKNSTIFNAFQVASGLIKYSC